MHLDEMFSITCGVCLFAAPGALLGGLIGLISTVWLPGWVAVIPIIVGGVVSFRFLAKHCVIQ